jgi:hypothetical protein
VSLLQEELPGLLKRLTFKGPTPAIQKAENMVIGPQP